MRNSNFCYFISGVYIFSAVANKFRLHKLNTVEKFVMSYGGKDLQVFF